MQQARRNTKSGKRKEAKRQAEGMWIYVNLPNLFRKSYNDTHSCASSLRIQHLVLLNRVSGSQKCRNCLHWKCDNCPSQGNNILKYIDADELENMEGN